MSWTQVISISMLVMAVGIFVGSRQILGIWIGLICAMVAVLWPLLIGFHLIVNVAVGAIVFLGCVGCFIMTGLALLSLLDDSNRRQILDSDSLRG